MERGAASGRSTGPDQVSWLLVYPDTYEIGLPNQGLQILYEILNERRRVGRTRLRAVGRPRGRAPNGLPLFSVDTHRPAGAFDVLAFNLSAELVYTNLLNCIDLAGVPVRAEDRSPADTRWSSPAATARSTPSRSPTSSTPS